VWGGDGYLGVACTSTPAEPQIPHLHQGFSEAASLPGLAHSCLVHVFLLCTTRSSPHPLQIWLR
jgi:hypothetical protein